MRAIRRSGLRRGARGAAATATLSLALTVTGPAHVVLAGKGAVITRLSNLHSLSRWAYPLDEAVIRASPGSRSRAVGRLRFLTIDEQAELYLTLASARLPSGASWIEIEVPRRPNGITGWVPRSALGALHAVKGYLLVDEERLKATLYRGGRAIFSAPVGVGKPSTVTPKGHFYVLEKLRAVNAPVYGSYALGTSAYAPTLSEWPGGGVVGIHGTDEPQLIPGRPSHGCVRMRDADAATLWRLIEPGTPIDIV